MFFMCISTVKNINMSSVLYCMMVLYDNLNTENTKNNKVFKALEKIDVAK